MTDNSYLAREIILVGAGQYLRELAVHSAVYDFHGNDAWPEIVEDILLNFLHLTALNIVGYRGYDWIWLALFGSQLHVLVCCLPNSAPIF